MFSPMAHVSSIKLSDEEKLAMLQRLDQFRHWHSLDEKRYCLVCGEIITGRQIQVIMGTPGKRSLRIICPTKYCDAMPMEWVQPTDEVLITIAMVEVERSWLRLIMRAGRAMQSCRSKTTSSTISKTRSRPLARVASASRKTEARGCEVPCDS
jgi:hypothetical protein